MYEASEARLPAYTWDTPQSSAAVNSNSMCLTGASSTLPLISLCALIKASRLPGTQNAVLHISAKSNWPVSQLTDGSILSQGSWRYKPMGVSLCRSVRNVQYLSVCVCVCVCVCACLWMSEVWVTVVCVHVAWGGQGSSVAAKWTRPLSVPSVARTASPSVLTHRSPDAHAATLLCHLSFSYVMEWCRRLTDYSHRLGVQQWSRIHFTSSVPIHFDHLKVKKSSKLKLLFVRKVDLKKKL